MHPLGSLPRLVLLSCVIIVSLLLGTAHGAAEFTDAAIRCKVCESAIAHIWHEGVELRTACHDHATDPRCDYHHLHHFGIEELTESVCDELPKKYTASHDAATDEFKMIRAEEDPKHPDVIVQRIRATCLKWMHQEHGIEEISRHIYANLDAKKTTEQILHPLTQRYCRNACDVDYKARRHHHHDEM
jgi:hypothetical protein